VIVYNFKIYKILIKLSYIQNNILHFKQRMVEFLYVIKKFLVLKGSDDGGWHKITGFWEFFHRPEF
jgi:hypothetical protein